MRLFLRLVSDGFLSSFFIAVSKAMSCCVFAIEFLVLLQEARNNINIKQHKYFFIVFDLIIRRTSLFKKN